MNIDEDNKENNFDPERDLETVFSFIRNIPASAPSVITCNSSFPYPNELYTIPVGGYFASSSSNQKNSKSRKAVLPDVLPIDISGHNVSLSIPFSSSTKMKQPQVEDTTRRSTEDSTTITTVTPTVVHLPPKKSSNKLSIDDADLFPANFDTPNDEESDKTALADQFLAQLPDLSFMLKSTLSLPKNE